ncbi:4Fe-4S dicluster domain-containing protein [Tomitella fengzijianii]|uniref:4Fe-4S dicluster domain-containing protein n=1 Tax=Tomitella fengzijianii TaxID=2597660 RepID=A0A516X5Z5_9ACTN|nr:(Fe-S)-binding protein [Tomitella fengzijianii]QDQ98466.1 4Fe-4S dicluster domain-containing protein [Tomitella fengzijianii]
MNALTITLGTVATVISLACWVMFASGVWRMVKTIALGQPDRTRNTPVVPRVKQVIVEFLAHTKMLKNRTVGIAHWFVMIGFLGGALLWFEAYGESFDPHFHWPVFGSWNIWQLWSEVLGLGTVIGVIVLMVIRQINHPRVPSRLSRFTGSDFKAAYFVEWVVLIEGLGMIFVKTFKIASGGENPPIWTSFFTHYFAQLFTGIDETAVSWAAVVKLLSGMIWLAVVGYFVTWGVAWHRFAAFFNIYFKREDDGANALGAVKPMMSGGKVLELEEADPEVDAFGAGKVEDFSWKGWLDFTTCTECGRCQSQCPAWNTGKPLSPKLMVMSLRDHGYAKAPYLLAGGGKDMGGEEIGLVDAEGNADEAALAKIPESARAEAERPLVGSYAEGEPQPVFDMEALWACTNCGACVEQCPVDIEHVDHIVDMRRYQVLIESEFPSELAGLFKNLENKGNPWGQNAKDRMNWISELEFDVPVYGKDVDSFDDFEYLFWVGCAGAYEDRAKKTTKAVAELLNIAAVKFMVLGDGETCTGDPARRAGNELIFQQLAMQNIDTLGEVFGDLPRKKRKIVSTCAHCFNTLTNEYPELGGEYEVVHHTQLLNRLVRDKRLTPVADPSPENTTYHDPCFLGRHNKVYDAPRELIGSSAKLSEMPRHAERSLCCGAGGARMWMEENIGKRINIERVEEALTTQPKKVVTACPFCKVMMADGVTAQEDKAQGVEVVDVAQVLLDGVRRGGATVNVSSPVREKPAAAAAGAGTATALKEAPAEAPEKPAGPPSTGGSGSSGSGSSGAAPKPAVKGLGMAGAGKAPGAKKPGGGAPAPGGAPKPAAKGLGMAGAAKAPGAKKPGAPKPAEQPAPESEATEAPAAPKPAAKGLGMAGAAKAPGAKKPGAPKAAAPKAPEAAAASEATEAPAAPKPAVKGLGMAGAAKAPGAKKPGAPKAAAPTAPEAESPEAAKAPEAEEPTQEATEAPAKPAGLSVKPKGLGLAGAAMAPGAKKPGAPKAGAPKPAAKPAEGVPEPQAAPEQEATSEAPAEKAQVEKAPAEKAQVEKAPAEKAQVEKAQVEKAQVEKAQVEKAQVEKAPEKQASDDDKPTLSVKPKGLGMQGGAKPPGKR